MSEYTMTIEQAIQVALQHQQAGQLSQAEHLCRQILQVQPFQVDAIHLLGVILAQSGNLKEATELFAKTLHLKPDHAEGHSNLGIALESQGRLEEAIACYERALILAPGQVNARHLLEKVTQVCHQRDKTIAIAHYQLGMILQAQGRLNEAMSCYWKAKMANKHHAETLVLGRLHSMKNWCETNQLTYQRIFPAQDFLIEKPKRIIGKFMPIDEGITQSNEQYVAEIPNARIFYRNNLILAADSAVLYDRLVHPLRDLVLVQESVCKAHIQDNLLIDYSEFKTLHAERGIMMSGFASGSFGHWIWEYLPKWQCYERFTEYQNDPIYVDADMPVTHYEALRMLVGNHRKIIHIPANTSIVFEKLVIAPTPTFMPTHIKPGIAHNRHLFPNLPPVLHYLQNQLGQAAQLTIEPSAKKGGRRRIYLSRRKRFTWRFLLNEQEIVNFLKDHYGFEEVFLEEMSFIEQMNTLNSADMVVAPRGSATCHLLFCKRHSKIVLLMNEFLENFPSFSTSLDLLGYQHWVVCGIAQNPQGMGKQANYVVPLERLKQAMVESLSL